MNHTSPPDLKEEKLLKNLRRVSEKSFVYSVDTSLVRNHGFSFVEAGLLCMIDRLQCRYKGYCFTENKYFSESLGVSDNTIGRLIKSLRDRKLLFTYYYKTRSGTRRHLVTPKSLSKYMRRNVRITDEGMIEKI